MTFIFLSAALKLRLSIAPQQNQIKHENGPEIAVLINKSLLEALIYASTNPKYDKRLFIDLPVQYMKTTSTEHVVYINCFECQNEKNNLCSELILFMYWTAKSMNNLLSYYGLVHE